MHDSEVDRTTSGTGLVVELTLADLRALEIVVSDRLSAGTDFSCDVVPTLAEVLELCRGRIDVMLDLKSGAAESALVVEATDMLDQVVMLGSASELEEARQAVPDLLVMIRPHEQSEIQPLWDSFSPPATVVHIDPGFDEQETLDQIHNLGVKVLIDMWGADALASVVGDWTNYAAEHERGIDIQESEWPFFALWSVGRASPP